MRLLRHDVVLAHGNFGRAVLGGQEAAGRERVGLPYYVSRKFCRVGLRSCQRIAPECPEKALGQ